LFTKQEIIRLTELHRSDPVEFNEAIKEYYTIRWTPDQILAGVKTHNNRSVTLVEAINTGSITKIDTVNWVLDRFLPIECFYDLGYLSETGQEEPFHPTDPYIDSLKADIDKYSHPSSFNPLKVLKRTWLLSRAIDCTSLLQVIEPVLSSDTAALSQISADISTLMILFEHIGDAALKPQYNLIFTEIFMLESRLANHSNPNAYVALSFASAAWNKWCQGGAFPTEMLQAGLTKLQTIVDTGLLSQATAYYEMVQNSDVMCSRVALP
jgi:hypothetical protein